MYNLNYHLYRYNNYYIVLLMLIFGLLSTSIAHCENEYTDKDYLVLLQNTVVYGDTLETLLFKLENGGPIAKSLSNDLRKLCEMLDVTEVGLKKYDSDSLIISTYTNIKSTLIKRIMVFDGAMICLYLAIALVILVIHVKYPFYIPTEGTQQAGQFAEQAGQIIN